MGVVAPTAVFNDADVLGTRPAVGAEAAARRGLRAQIGMLEAELAEAFVTAFEMRIGAPVTAAAGPGVPRLLDLGELELVRDELAGRLGDARAQLADTAAEQSRKRELLARMQLDPGHYRFARISCRELGEPGCGVWQVRPRLGLVGMLMGWWQVTLSSGCPLARGRGRRRMPTRS
jgi:hypothetical protein